VEAEQAGTAPQRRLQIVHSHSPFVAGKLAQRIARRHGALHVTTFHSKYRDDFLKSVPSDNLATVFVERIVEFYESADAVWTPSEATAETLRNYGFGGKVTVMPNGADLEPPDEAGYEALRRRGGEILEAPLPEDGGEERAPFILLFVGQHRWEKNIRLIIDGLSELSNTIPRPIRAVFAGTGADAGEIEAYARKRSVRELCDFRGLVLDREYLKALYARADLFIFPSLYDNAPLVLREAAAFRTPAVLAAGSSAAADTEDGRNAFHVEPEPGKLARLITKLSTEDEAVKRVGLGARDEVYRGWKDIVTDVADRYRLLLSPGKAG
jgi:glycosyltransferase involved in cell wall biosynthesis